MHTISYSFMIEGKTSRVDFTTNLVILQKLSQHS